MFMDVYPYFIFFAQFLTQNILLFFNFGSLGRNYTIKYIVVDINLSFYIEIYTGEIISLGPSINITNRCSKSDFLISEKSL